MDYHSWRWVLQSIFLPGVGSDDNGLVQYDQSIRLQAMHRP
jgi:hypothetical protein